MHWKQRKLGKRGRKAQHRAAVRRVFERGVAAAFAAEIDRIRAKFPDGLFAADFDIPKPVPLPLSVWKARIKYP